MTAEKNETSEQPPAATESSVIGVSVRGWVTLLIVGTVCAMSLLAMAVDEPLRGGFIFCIGFYFGQKIAKAG
jgi:hypothetical protein